MISLPIRPSRLVIACLVGAGCSQSTEPATPRPPTLLVANPLCDDTGCKTIELRAFVWEYHIPQNPNGAEPVGAITGPTTCIEFPEGWQIVVTEVTNGGDFVRADTLTSTLDDDITLMLVDNHALVAATDRFAPGTELGWSLAFSANPNPQAGVPYVARLTPAPRCTPEVASGSGSGAG